MAAKRGVRTLNLQLTAYGDDHWRATFCVTGMAHSIAGGSAWAAASKDSGDV